RLRLELGRPHAGALELEGERHGEAAGMRRRDQLLRVRSLLALEPGLERVGRRREHAGIGRQLAPAVLAGPAPDGARFADHRDISSIGTAILAGFAPAVPRETMLR